jgi:hypothetical protein
VTAETTLAAIRAHQPCADSWRAFLAALRNRDGRTRGDDEPFPLTWILDLASLADARWCLRLAPTLARWYAVDCAERVLPLYEARVPGDARVRACIETTRRYLAGQATQEEVRRARYTDAANAAYAYTNAAYAAANAAYADAAAYAATAATAAADANAAADAAAYADAAANAAYAAYAAAARPTEESWQRERLRQYWSGQVPAPLMVLGLNPWTDYRRAA